MEVSHKQNPKDMTSDGSKGGDPYKELGQTGAELPNVTENMNVTNKNRVFETRFKDGGNKKGAERSGK